ncbi:serine hydrolase domain-containing protein [Saccharicrinis sp. FJH2]|uniref:serine hydrolase domain-containing protein n=1 Tax=Saccharicrinis sp. FJH65 TaxID=3344659 RepID=UPI0035F27658
MKFRKLFFLPIFFIASFYSCEKEEFIDVMQKTELEKIIDSEFSRCEMPGLTCAAVKEDSIVYIGYRGYANVKDKVELSSQTRMLVGSVSKTLTLTAIMQLYDRGLIELDADINSYLPFEVRNPRYADVPITVRMLLMHSSSISDSYTCSLLLFWGYEDFPESLMHFEQNYLTANGQYYSKDNYSDKKPGTTYLYSNVAASLIACLVEYVTGEGFNAYCKENIFYPLGMNKTTWLYSETPKDEMAIPYANIINVDPQSPFYSQPNYPSGNLITTAEDLSKFMRAFIMDGSYNDYQLLKPQTVDLILHDYKDRQGLIFVGRKMGKFTVWGHTGLIYGAAAEMFFDRDQRVGYIMITNRNNIYSRKAAIGNALLLYAKRQ